MSGKLLIATGSIADMKKCLAKYFYSTIEQITLTPSGENKWLVTNGSKVISTAAVFLKKKRYRFEMLS